ncbi:MAG: alanine--glyoxylate aminotransferase family protein [Chloroflexota bacterium]|nr:alanine--glyoxylate aminotransferase family protein [Chloroflexota bacterium]
MPDIAHELDPPSRLLLGPGPSNVHPRVSRALAAPVLGYLDPAWFTVMDETVALLRRVYGTENRVTFPISGTGTAGMEALLYNLLEPGDKAIIGVNGYFGDRLHQIALRAGAEVLPLRAPWGQPVDPERVRIALKENPGVSLVAVVHGETSTGVLQPLDRLGEIVRQYGALLLVDCVTTLGGEAVDIDANGIDAAYSCTQKALSCPPGLSPITLSERAWEKIARRKTPAQSWYLDLKLLAEYWLGNRTYHHTPPVAMIYALREGLRLVLEEGPEQRYARHRRNAAALRAGLAALGLPFIAADPYSLPTLTAVQPPAGVDEAALRAALRDRYGIEIGGGLGPLRGKAWRIGLMGVNATAANVLLVLTALEAVLAEAGYPVAPGAASAAARQVLAAAPSD